MARAVYLFEAKGLQPYILDGGKLRDAVGASELVDSLSRTDGGDLLAVALAACGIADDGSRVKFSRRASAAFEMHAEDRELLIRFRQLWQLALGQYAPGLEYEDVITELSDNPAYALHKARNDPVKRALRRGGSAALLPAAGPFIRRSQRTGAPAVKLEHEDIDQATVRKRRFSARDDLACRFAPEDGRERIWPTHFVEDGEPDDRSDPQRAFPFAGDDRTIAIVHIDGNGMGERLRELDAFLGNDPKQIDRRLAFSKAIEQATQGAAQAATVAKLDHPYAVAANDGVGMRMPARPIVLGGDDLTAIIRGDLAVPFVVRFLEEFEMLSERKLGEAFPRAKDAELARKMTACAGIVFIGATQPFYLAYDLAAELCKNAKSRVRGKVGKGAPLPSGVQFHRVTTSFIADWDSILRDELSIGPGPDDEPVRLTCQPYAMGAAESGLPDLGVLVAACDALRDLDGRGALRDIWSLVKSDIREAKRAYGRWRAMREKSESKTEREAFRAFDTHLGGLTGDDPKRLLGEDDRHPLPIGDLLSLIEAGYGRVAPPDRARKPEAG